MNDIEWGTVLSLAGLFVAGCVYLTHQMNRFDGRMDRFDDSLSKRFDRLEAKIDQLTDRHIAHLEHHPR